MKTRLKKTVELIEKEDKDIMKSIFGDSDTEVDTQCNNLTFQGLVSPRSPDGKLPSLNFLRHKNPNGPSLKIKLHNDSNVSLLKGGELIQPTYPISKYIDSKVLNPPMDSNVLGVNIRSLESLDSHRHNHNHSLATSRRKRLSIGMDAKQFLLREGKLDQSYKSRK